MKRNISLPLTVTMIALLSIAISLSSCKKNGLRQDSDNNSDLSEKNNKDKNSEHSSKPLKVDLIHIYTDVEDANMMPPMGNNTILFNKTGHVPILAPDGHHVTLGEFNSASGKAEVKCMNNGTHVEIHMHGLIPKGVYTIWIMTFKTPGFNGTFDNLTGVGALGAPDGSQNAWVATSNGKGELSVTTPAEMLSIFGSVPNCFGGEFEVLLSAAYHLDGRTHGGSPGDFTNYVLQFGFPVMGARL